MTTDAEIIEYVKTYPLIGLESNHNLPGDTENKKNCLTKRKCHRHSCSSPNGTMYKEETDIQFCSLLFLINQIYVQKESKQYTMQSTTWKETATLECEAARSNRFYNVTPRIKFFASQKGRLPSQTFQLLSFYMMFSKQRKVNCVVWTRLLLRCNKTRKPRDSVCFMTIQST